VASYPSLTDGVVVLDPLTADHVGAFAEAGSGDRSTFGYTWVPNGLADAQRYVDLALAQVDAGASLAYAVVLAESGRVIGSTRLWEFVRFDQDAPHPQAGEIGFTWYAADVQRTGVNTAVKSLLFGLAFDEWSVLRLSLKTHAANSRSRAAIERLGATFEGVRRVLPSTQDGSIRDVAFYSVIRSEWPEVKLRLAAMRRYGS
jgi:RimJ/RimL family protein N-acetyltransferase